MAYLKDEIPADIAEILRQAEARADECWRALHLRHYPADLAIWAVLTGGIRMVEGEQATRGSNTPHFDAMLANLSRLLAIAVKWAIGHGQPPADPPIGKLRDRVAKDDVDVLGRACAVAQAQLERHTALDDEPWHIGIGGTVERAGHDHVRPPTRVRGLQPRRDLARTLARTSRARRPKAVDRSDACDLRSSRALPRASGSSPTRLGSQQLTLQAICRGHGQDTRPSSVGDRLGDKLVPEVAGMRVADRSSRGCDRHTLYALDIGWCQVRVMDDQSFR